MSVHFHHKYQPIEDTLICSGVELKKSIVEDYLKKNQIDRTSQAGISAVKAIESDYESHKTELKGIKYSDYLVLVEKSIPDLKSTQVSDHAREIIIRKLDKLSLDAQNEEKNAFKASTFPKMSQFFHKIGQLFKGHHFQTEGKYGQELAKELLGYKEGIWNQELKDLVHGKALPAWVSIQNLTKKVNNFNDEQFNEFIMAFKRIYDTPAEGSVKYNLYKGLNQDKKERIQNRFSEINWYGQVFKILAYRKKEEVNDFISDAMIDRFLSYPEPFFITWSFLKERQNETFKPFAACILERAALRGSEAKIRHFMNDKEFGAEIRNILNRN